MEFWKFFDFFWNFSKPDPPWNTGQFFFRKKCHKTCWKQVWTILELWIFCHFFLEIFLSLYFKIKVRKTNWTQIFYVRKTELIFLSSEIWTHNFKSRKSEMELRILTLAWMQKECLLIIVSENWTHIFKFGNLNS